MQDGGWYEEITTGQISVGHAGGNPQRGKADDPEGTCLFERRNSSEPGTESGSRGGYGDAGWECCWLCGTGILDAEQTAGCGLRHGGPAGSDGGVPAA